MDKKERLVKGSIGATAKLPCLCICFPVLTLLTSSLSSANGKSWLRDPKNSRILGSKSENLDSTFSLCLQHQFISLS